MKQARTEGLHFDGLRSNSELLFSSSRCTQSLVCLFQYSRSSMCTGADKGTMDLEKKQEMV